MKKTIRLTESDLVKLVQRVVNEQSQLQGHTQTSTMNKDGVTKTKTSVNPPMSSPQKNYKLSSGPTNKDYNMIDTCASMGVKTPGYCDTQGKKPVKSCASLGVKTPGFCYVDTKKPIPNQAPPTTNKIK
jgi:hypothetical protein